MAIADEIDVVHVCTPNALHGPLVRAALSAGKHVVCEKPLSLTGADSDVLVELAARAGLVNAVPLVYRYHPMTVEARERVRRGEIGDIRLIHGHYLQDWLARPEDNNWRVDPAVGGASRAFADIGSHWCDLVEWISGHRISELTAATQTVLPKRAAAGRETFTGTGPRARRNPPNRRTRRRRATSPPRTPSRSCSVPTAARPAPWSSRRSRRGARTGSGSRWTAPSAALSYDGEDPESLCWAAATGREVARPRRPDGAGGEVNAVPAGHPWGYRDCFAAFIADVYAAIRDPETAAGAAPAFPTFADAARTARTHRGGPELRRAPFLDRGVLT